ncbi:sigma-70 family RNA polymerase sigma factor [Sphingobacterium spiritivorum]|uniref:sigma-70 family RNA polymerase sigma factor n=1 Tax=Sphingobacterium spiritivorum TaxID=258 RepID=UPI003DA4E61B
MSSSQKDVELWIENYSGSLLRQAYFLLANKEDAEDLVQDVFMTAFLMKDRYQGKSSPLTWLKGILNHKAADLYRRKYRGNETVSMDYFFDQNGGWRDQDVRHHWDINTDTSASLLDNEKFNKSLQECLQALPQKWGFLIRQCYIQQKKAEEICQEVNISTTNYWKILQRSRMQLRKCLDIKWFNNTNNA